jgi:hypothetical protein
MAQLEVAIAEVDDAEPGRVMLLGCTRDPVVIDLVRAHLFGREQPGPRSLGPPVRLVPRPRSQPRDVDA